MRILEKYLDWIHTNSKKIQILHDMQIKPWDAFVAETNLEKLETLITTKEVEDAKTERIRSQKRK